MDLQLRDKVILVSGGSDGIGFGIAKTLAEEGATVVLGARGLEKLEQAAAELQKISPSVLAQTLDVTDPSSIAAWVNFAVENCRHIDGVVINAGGPPAGRFQTLDDKAWEQGFNLILMNAVRLIRGCLPHLQQREASSIVAITSTSVKEPIDDLLLSTVFRSGVNALLKSLARDLASHNIRVNNVVPGRFATERIMELNELVAKRTGRPMDEVIKDSQADIPLGRYGTVEEIGRAVTFLLSPAASYITGEMLLVDGGLVKTGW